MRKPPASLWFGLTIVGLLLLASLAAPLITSYSPTQPDPTAILEAPSARHLAGTDELGRDVFARIVWGGRASLGVAFGIVGLSVGMGAVAGAALGLARGWIDAVAMRFVDVFLSIPSMVIALALSAALGPSLSNLVLVLGVLGVPYYARLFRGEALAIRERLYVRVAAASGAGFGRILAHHVLPSIAPTIVTFASGALGGALVAASALSFIGLGAQPPTPEWGAEIYDGRNTIMYEWWCAILPGCAVMTAALGFIISGDALRDWLDPRSEPQ
jgi:peptide/nickel transport system permease protein